MATQYLFLEGLFVCWQVLATHRLDSSLELTHWPELAGLFPGPLQFFILYQLHLPSLFSLSLPFCPGCSLNCSVASPLVFRQLTLSPPSSLPSSLPGLLCCLYCFILPVTSSAHNPKNGKDPRKASSLMQHQGGSSGGLLLVSFNCLLSQRKVSTPSQHKSHSDSLGFAPHLSIVS